ncbi:CMRF35-like molecule 1 isoform X1 [Pristis pectinata]|uniref:CMRF35-like molecule 1 isoform X1 n=1 Tax=Pristis pectinata TaxID=685728 RepID=UPI00223E19EC|nr:CMRF35-like molecule 1 isoform X1 [Pristis pectinata]
MALTLLLSVAFLSVTHADISGPNVKTGTVGRQVEIICRFNTFFSNYQKYWCKGYYRRSCAILVQTQGPEMKSGDGRITITADNEKGQLTIRMDRLTKNDRGWYWCGIERPHLLDPLSPVELKVHEGQKLLPSDKERLRFFIILGLVFGILTMMFLGLLVLVIKKIRKNKNDAPTEHMDGCRVEFKGMQAIEGQVTDKKERESTIENSIPKSNSVLSKEKEAGVTYATVMIQPTDHPQQDSTTYDNVNPSNSQEENKPPVTEPPTSEPIEYSTIVFKK